MTRKLMLSVVVCMAGFWGADARGDDWPTYRHDVRRSGISSEKIEAPLSAQWVFTATHPPEHAWGDPQPKPVERVLELPRLRFDDAFHVAAVGEMIYFGSSADNKVYALDAKTGEIRWEFCTDGPVRLAPTVYEGKVYVGSDDGWVYCLDAQDARPVWKFRAAPADRKLLGNGKMISVWPVRTGVAVDAGVAYFGAGVFPADGLYLYAVGAADGKLIWKNDSYADGGKAGISPQGCLVASKERLFVPACRTMPAGFDRKTGRFLFQRNLSWRLTGLFGGTSYQLAGGILFGGTEQVIGSNEASGHLAVAELLPARKPSTGTRQLIAAEDKLYLLTGKELVASDRRSWIGIRGRMTQLKLRVSSLGRQRSTLGGKERALQKQREARKTPGGKLAPRTRDHEAVLKQIADVTRQVNEANAEFRELAKKQGEPTKWTSPFAGSDSLIMTGGMLLAGGPGVVTAFEAAGGKPLWSGKVNGKARGLAVAGGRVLVSTDNGGIHCFASGRGGAAKEVKPETADEPFPKDMPTEAHEKLAARLVGDSGVRRGYALILGGDGRLAHALARRSELMIYLIERDAAKVAAARKALTAGGVYGAKVVVTRAQRDLPPLADYFANLIVWRAGFCPAPAGLPPMDLLRMLKPCGGVAYVFPPRGGAPAAGEMTKWLAALGKVAAKPADTGLTAASADGWTRISRGALAGAGKWTHQYAEPGNTACSDDKLVKGAIGTLWYGEPGPGRMANRHASAASPLAVGGRMFVQGEDVVMAYDAYNGLLLWQRDIKGATRLNLKRAASNLAADANGLFVAVADRCLRLDPATGRTLNTYNTPPGKDGKTGRWQYVACVGGTLYGSRDNRCVFAVDIESGKLRWAHEARDIDARTICIGDGRVYFVGRGVTEAQQAEAMKGIPPARRLDRRGKPIRPDVRLVVALNADTGREDWARPQYISDCVRIGRSGGDLILMYADNILLLCGQPWNGHFWREMMAGEFSRRSLIALSGYDGRLLWSGRKGYRSRPLIVGGRIIAEPWAHDLQTGAEKNRTHPVTGIESKWQMSRPGHHCGNIAGAPNALFFRSGATAYYDLTGDYGTAHFAGQRPGCWVNWIPACGLVMMPEASSGCICPFALHCTIVFQPRKANRVWGMYSATGSMLPVKRLAVNFGAPGDRKDSAGTLWLAYPRPRSYERDYDQRLVLDFKIGMKPASGDAGYFHGNADFLKVDGSDEPWIYAFGCTGFERCSIPLIEQGGRAARYKVRLYFAAPETDRPGGRVFDVALQGKTVLKDFDVAAQAGGANRAVVKEFKGVRVTDALAVSMKAAKGKALLCGVDIIREEK